MAVRQPSDVSAYSGFVAARSASLFRTAYLVIGDHFSGFPSPEQVLLLRHPPRGGSTQSLSQ